MSDELASFQIKLQPIPYVVDKVKETSQNIRHEDACLRTTVEEPTSTLFPNEMRNISSSSESEVEGYRCARGTKSPSQRFEIRTKPPNLVALLQHLRPACLCNISSASLHATLFCILLYGRLLVESDADGEDSLAANHFFLQPPEACIYMSDEFGLVRYHVMR